MLDVSWIDCSTAYLWFSHRIFGHSYGTKRRNALQRRSFFYPFILALALLAWCGAAVAQIESGAVNGTVSDHAGARIAHAKVTITDIGTNQSQMAETGADGSFHFAQLKPSRYRLKISADGFKEGVLEGLELHTQDNLSEEITLE